MAAIKPIPAMTDYSAELSNCADCSRTNLSARDSRVHYVTTGHYLIPQVGNTDSFSEAYWAAAIPGSAPAPLPAHPAITAARTLRAAAHRSDSVADNMAYNWARGMAWQLTGVDVATEGAL